MVQEDSGERAGGYLGLQPVINTGLSTTGEFEFNIYDLPHSGLV